MAFDDKWLSSLCVLGRISMVFRHRGLFRWLELPVITTVLLFIFCNAILSVPFNPDESQWIASSDAYEAFVRGDNTSPIWNESLWTLTQPPGARYIIGVGRSAGGYQVSDLNTPWSFGRTEAANIAAGAMPKLGLLWWSRLPMALLSVVSCLLLFKLVSTTSNRATGYVCLLLVVCNPFMLETLRRAMAEAPLLLSLLLTTYAGTRVLQTYRHTSADAMPVYRKLLQPLLWLMIMGVFIGIAGSIKLNGLIAVVGAIILWVLTFISPINKRSARGQLHIVVAGCVLILVVTAITFIIFNPYLYPEPLERTMRMVQFRANALQQQQIALPNSVIHSLRERIALTYKYLFQYTTIVRFPGAGLINFLLWTTGVYYLLRMGWRSLRQCEHPHISIVILVMALTCAGPMLLTPLKWDRYFLLPIVFSIIYIAIGIIWNVQNAGKVITYFFYRKDDEHVRSSILDS